MIGRKMTVRGFIGRSPVRAALVALLVLAALSGAGTECATSASKGASIVSGSQNVKVGDKVFQVSYVRVDLGDPKVRLRVVLGQDMVGGTEDLVSMAARAGAQAAIN
nr:hypothetical protein [Bacillota bacterium]